MNESDLLNRMVPPSKVRPDRYRGGILQIMITRACSESCGHCTQLSNMAGKPAVMTPEQFEKACDSLQGYFGVVGIFGGDPPMSPYFGEICEIFRSKFPLEQRGLWSNHPRGKADICAQTFYPPHSNLNVHLDMEAYKEFAEGWPASIPYLKGHVDDSRHGPPFVSRIEIGIPQDEIDEGTATCEVNQFWSALIGVVHGELKGFICELMYALDVLHENDPEWPMNGMTVEPGWWKRPVEDFADQVRTHCGHCGMPMKGFGQLAIGATEEQMSPMHAKWFKSKVGRPVRLITHRDQLKEGGLPSAITYIENSSLPVIQ